MRYLPAAEAARVGGDWYDAFLQPAGATMLVIGDVVGHDTEAAAAMGQLRGLLRGSPPTATPARPRCCAAWTPSMTTLQTRHAGHGGGRPVRADTRRARPGHHPHALGQRGPPAARWWSTPTAASPSWPRGRATCSWASTPRPDAGESVVTLDRGATVLLYTDGLVERRTPTWTRAWSGCATP